MESLHLVVGAGQQYTRLPRLEEATRFCGLTALDVKRTTGRHDDERVGAQRERMTSNNCHPAAAAQRVVECRKFGGREGQFPARAYEAFCEGGDLHFH